MGGDNKNSNHYPRHMMKRGGGGSASASGRGRSKTVRSSTVLEVSDTGEKWTNFGTPEARMASIDPVLHRAKSEKQPKAKEGVMKTL